MKKEKKQRERLWQEAAGHCVYCGHPVSVEQMEVDHINPLSSSRDNSFMNRVCSCSSCNKLKGNRPLEDFLLEEYDEHALKKYENRIDNLVRGGRMSPVKAIELTPLEGLYEDDELPSAPGLVLFGGVCLAR